MPNGRKKERRVENRAKGIRKKDAMGYSAESSQSRRKVVVTMFDAS